MDPEFATAGPEPFCSSPSSIDGNKTESVLKGEEAFPLQLALFAPVLIPLASYAANTELPSHVLLIPFVSTYLIYLKRQDLPRILETTISWATIPFFLAEKTANRGSDG